MNGLDKDEQRLLAVQGYEQLGDGKAAGRHLLQHLSSLSLARASRNGVQQGITTAFLTGAEAAAVKSGRPARLAS